MEEQEHQPVFHELLKKHNDDASGKAGGSGDEKDGGMSSKISHVLLTKKRDRILSTLKKLERMSREVQELKDNFQQSMTRCSEEVCYARVEVYECLFVCVICLFVCEQACRYLV